MCKQACEINFSSQYNSCFIDERCRMEQQQQKKALMLHKKMPWMPPGHHNYTPLPLVILLWLASLPQTLQLVCSYQRLVHSRSTFLHQQNNSNSFTTAWLLHNTILFDKDQDWRVNNIELYLYTLKYVLMFDQHKQVNQSQYKAVVYLKWNTQDTHSGGLVSVSQ